eukprot:TRINITY_DN55420_c0_g1_i1.p1 TRINITY_DN55420_c0_g1~~TRINITY_DN55420_c0_g1_i1.p1  ORF type:complete len:957 (+),score=190.83 TRINITY_DN55420_c0_g1_i1:110-2872(+)
MRPPSSEQTRSSVAYLTSVGAPEVFADLCNSLLEHRPPKERLCPFLAEALLRREAKGVTGASGNRARVLAQLPHAHTAAAAGAIFACAQSVDSGWSEGAPGVLDLALDDPGAGKRHARWQVRCCVEHNPFSACPLDPGQAQTDWHDAPGQDAAQQLADVAQHGDAPDSPQVPQPVLALDSPDDPTEQPFSPNSGQKDDPAGPAPCVTVMLGLMEGSVQHCQMITPCPSTLAARIAMGARASDVEAGALVVRSKQRWKYGDLDGGGEGLVLGVGMQHAGGAHAIRVRWPNREYVHHRDERCLRLSPMSAWRATVDLRRAPETPGQALLVDGALALARVLRLGVPLRELLLRNNLVGDEGAAALLDAIRVNRHVVHVDISGGSTLPTVPGLSSPRSPEAGRSTFAAGAKVGEDGTVAMPQDDEADPAGLPVGENDWKGDVSYSLHAAIFTRCAHNAAAAADHEMLLSHMTCQGEHWLDHTAEALWDADCLHLPWGDLARKHSAAAAQLLVTIMRRRQQGGLRMPRRMLHLYSAADGAHEAGPSVTADSPAELLAQLTAQGASMEETDSRGRSALHLAAEHGKVSAAAELVRSGADVTSMCDGRVVAFYAVLNPAFRERSGPGWEVLKLMATPEALQKLGTSANFPGAGDGGPPDDFTALHAASWEGSSQAVGALVELGARTDVKSTRGHYPLVIAVRSTEFDEHPEALTGLCTDAVLKDTDSKGRSPLHWACNKGRPRAAAHLVKLGADVNMQSKCGRTPLHESMRDLKFENEHGIEALALLATPESLKAVGEEATASTHSGATALHSAAFFGRDKMIRALVPLGADLEARNAQGHTPLHRAAARGSLRALEALVEMGAAINATTPDGATALQIACAHPAVWQRGELELARRALGCTPSDEPVAGLTPRSRGKAGGRNIKWS